jgi:hypothetical protein
MSQPKQCLFVAGRQCPFKTAQVSFQTCQLCIEAWKTDVAMQQQQAVQVQNVPAAPTQTPNDMKHLTIATSNVGTPVMYNEGLKQIDDLLKDDNIDPMEYVMLRKQQIDALMDQAAKGRTSSLSIDHIEEPVVNEIKPAPKQVRVAVVVKTLFGKQVYTSPGDWKLPKSISDKVIKSIFHLSEKKRPRDIKLRAGDYKLACVSHEKGKFAIMVIDADEEFDTYEHEIERVSDILKSEKMWAVALKKLEN